MAQLYKIIGNELQMIRFTIGPHVSGLRDEYAFALRSVLRALTAEQIDRLASGAVTRVEHIITLEQFAKVFYETNGGAGPHMLAREGVFEPVMEEIIRSNKAILKDFVDRCFVYGLTDFRLAYFQYLTKDFLKNLSEFNLGSQQIFNCSQEELSQLPLVSSSLVEASANLASSLDFDIHKRKLNYTHGKPLLSVLNKRTNDKREILMAMREMHAWESEFARYTSLQQEYAYVFRGIRIKDRLTYNLNFDTVTFAGLNLDTSLIYALAGNISQKDATVGIVFAIKITRGFPIIRTKIQYDEIILPYNSALIVDESIPQCQMKSNMADELVHVIFTICVPAKRQRLTTL